MFDKLFRGLCALTNGGHEWVILGSRLRCKNCNAHYTPPEKDVKIYPGRYVTGHGGSERCGEGDHQWETTRLVVCVGEGGYVEDFICKQCGEVKRNVQGHEKKSRLSGTLE